LSNSLREDWPKEVYGFLPTRGGPFGEQLPTPGGSPGPDAVRVELTPRGKESWAEIIEKAAKTACEPRS